VFVRWPLSLSLSLACCNAHPGNAEPGGAEKGGAGTG
jgi:hypothetical protein